ncbi:MAG TPA: hypothetical protein VE871_13030 [Longimicrobium sp.]|nr:hypothetical protein [Longimicrobium sp.]
MDQPPRQEIILPKGNVDLLFNLGDCVHGEGLIACTTPSVVIPAGGPTPWRGCGRPCRRRTRCR